MPVCQHSNAIRDVSPTPTAVRSVWSQATPRFTCASA